MFAREPCQSGARACQGDSRACQAWLSCPRRRLSQKVSTGRSIVPMVSLRLLNVTASGLRPRTGGVGRRGRGGGRWQSQRQTLPCPTTTSSSSSSCSGHRSFRRVRCPPPFHPQRSPERQPSGGRSGFTLRNLTTLYSYRSSSSSPSVRTSSPLLRASSRVLCQRGARRGEGRDLVRPPRGMVTRAGPQWQRSRETVGTPPRLEKRGQKGEKRDWFSELGFPRV
jgi:hypothetical protein